MFALTYPYIIVILLIISAFAIYKRCYILSIIVFAVCLLLNYHAKVFALNLLDFADSNLSCIKVLTFNINGSEISDDNEIDNLFNLIVQQDADLLFLAEVFDNVGDKLNTLLIRHYPYSTYEQKTVWGGHYFYSKYPLGRVDHIGIESNRFSYCFHCNMALGQDSISLFGCHFASNNYKVNEPSIRPEKINGVSSFSEYLNNIEMATKQRMEEVKGITEHPNFNNMSIVLGDFNDVCGSKPLRVLENSGFKDAWWEKGHGYGATISCPLPFRIDHIMYREGLNLKSIKNIDSQGLSDHNALVASFEL